MAKRRVEKLPQLHRRADLPELYGPHFHDYIDDRIILRSRKRRLTTNDRVGFQDEIADANRRGDITNEQAEYLHKRLSRFSGAAGVHALSLGHRIAGTYTKYAKKRKRAASSQKRVNKRFAAALFSSVNTECPLCLKSVKNLTTHMENEHPYEMEARRKNPNDSVAFPRSRKS